MAALLLDEESTSLQTWCC